MGRSIQPVAALDATSFPREFSLNIPSGRTLRVYHDQNGWHQSESEPNVFLEDYALDYAVGAGANGFTFLIHRGNYLFQAPLSFYSSTGKWGLSPGYENVDLGFSRPAPEACLACHSGRANAVPHRDGKYREPPFEELAIGCENCHGPGSDHVKALGRGAIVNPAKLSPRLAEDICMNCHQRGDTRILQPGKTYSDFRPGQPLFSMLAIFKVPASSGANASQDLLEHDAAMKASQCFRASGGKLSCLTCHDPHTQPAGSEAVAFYRSKCLTCHTNASCRIPLNVRSAKTPSNDCAGCHMPKRDVTVISHSALTNHRIPGPADSAFTPAPQDPATGLILIDAPPNAQPVIPDLTLLRAYAELAPRYPAYQSRYLETLQHLAQTEPNEPLVEAALGHKSLAEGKNEDALAQLSRAVVLDDAAVYFDLAKASSNLGRTDDAVSYLLRAINADPFNAVFQKTLILEYINLKRYPDARQAMEQYVKSFPGDAFMRGLLARVSN